MIIEPHIARAFDPLISNYIFSPEGKAKVGMYLKNALKAKNSLCSVVDKIEDLSSQDAACKALLGTNLAEVRRGQFQLALQVYLGWSQIILGRWTSFLASFRRSMPNMRSLRSCRRRETLLASLKRSSTGV